MSKINLQELFSNLQNELLAKLNVGKSISHPTAKGDDTELNWIEVLKSLPSRYQVNKGFVIDAEGNLSEQIDAIVYDRYYSPLLLRKDSILYVPSESVYAVLEVKQSLSKNNIEYAGGKIKSVRELKRTSAPVRQIDGSLRRREQLPPILGGILTVESEWNPPFGDAFTDTLTILDEISKLDFGIALKHGSFDCSYKENGELIFKTSKSEVSLISFFINLTKQLQLLGNAPGIDLDAYYK
ncbi:MAG: hypothetical protein M3Q44_07820 [bacterium]|nr:hypothetical protein [bacterium]